MAHTPQGRRCASISECNACAQDRTHSIAFHTQHATHRHCKMQQCPLPRQVNFADNRSSRMDVSVFQVSRPYVSFTEIRSKCDSARSSSSHARSSLQYSSRQCSVQTDHHRAQLMARPTAEQHTPTVGHGRIRYRFRYRIASHRIAIAVCSHSFVWPSTALVGYHLVPPVKGSYSIRSCLFMYSADGSLRRMGTSRLYAVRPHCGASVETLPQASERADLQGSAWYGTLRSCASTTDGLGAAARTGSARIHTSEGCATVAPLISEFQHTVGTTVRSTAAVVLYSNGAGMTEAGQCQGRHCL